MILVKRSVALSKSARESRTRVLLKEKMPLEKHGKLISIEGPDGSGKTTVVEGLARFLDEKRLSGVVSNWNDTTEIYNLMMQLNASGDLTNDMRCVFGAVELAAWFHYVITPALAEGNTVFAVKYLVSAVAHALIRGHDPDFVERLYDFAPKPDLVLYVDIDPEIALNRKVGERSVGFWEAGLDLAVSVPLKEALREYSTGVMDNEFISRSFVAFQRQLRDLHLSLLEGYNVVHLDGRRPPEVVAFQASQAVARALGE